MADYNINFIHVCDAANIDSLGKLSILGIFNRIFLPSVPGKFHRITVVLNMTLNDGSKKNHNLKIIITGPKNEELDIKQPIAMNFQTPEVDPKKNKPELNLILDLLNLEFKNFGKHLVRVILDDKEIGTKQLLLEQKLK